MQWIHFALHAEQVTERDGLAMLQAPALMQAMLEIFSWSCWEGFPDSEIVTS